jgi:hypothetical protein
MVAQLLIDSRSGNLGNLTSPNDGVDWRGGDAIGVAWTAPGWPEARIGGLPPYTLISAGIAGARST